MGVAKPVTIGGRQFARQKDALEFFKAMLGRYNPGQRVNAEDAIDLANLLKRHRNYEDKVGLGVDYFVVMDDGHGWKCFGIVRVDGTLIDFTYVYCVTQRW